MANNNDGWEDVSPTNNGVNTANNDGWEDVAPQLTADEQAPQETSLMDAISTGVQGLSQMAKKGVSEGEALANALGANILENLSFTESQDAWAKKFRADQAIDQKNAQEASLELDRLLGGGLSSMGAKALGTPSTVLLGGIGGLAAKGAQAGGAALVDTLPWLGGLMGMDTAAEIAATGDMSGVELEDVSKVAGDTAAAIALGKVGEKAIESIPTITNKAGEGLDYLKLKIDDRSKTKRFKQNIIDNPNNAELAKLKVIKDKAGKEKVVNDDIAISAVKQGWSEKAVAPIKNASAADKMQMNEMLSIQERASKDAKYALDNRPTDIIGTSLEKRINYISKTKKDAGNELNKVAEGLKGQKVDYTTQVDGLKNALTNLGVSMKTNKNGKTIIDFKGSDISRDSAGNGLIRDIFDKLDKGDLDAKALHSIKRMLNSKLTFTKKQSNPISNEADIALKDFRTSINDILGQNFEGYRTVNTKYGEAANALKDIQKSAGTSIDLDKDNAGKALGTASRKLLSNSVNRINMTNAMKNVDDISKKYGGKFDDSLSDLVIFADELERKFGSAAPTSFQGGIEKGVDAAIRAGTQSTTTTAGEVARAGIRKLRGVDDKNAIKTMRKILKEENIKPTKIAD